MAAIRAAGTRADFVRADLKDAASATGLARAAKTVLGHVDILVNSAGSGAFGPTVDTTESAFDELFALNVKVPYFLTAAVAPGMIELGAGVIVNVSTMVAEFGLDGMALHGSTKAALELLTKAWSAEFGPKGIRVNAVAPGPVTTKGTEGMRDAQGYLASFAPARRLSTATRSQRPSPTSHPHGPPSPTASCSRSTAAWLRSETAPRAHRSGVNVSSESLIGDATTESAPVPWWRVCAYGLTAPTNSSNP